MKKAILLSLVTATFLFSAPSGGVVTAGSASIAQSGAITTITQTTNKASINWQNFSIGSNETVNFNQPNVSAITLNRVLGNEKSIIDGALNANGQVFLLNSNGVLFSKNASINTAGLVATTMNLSDADFMNENFNFKGDSSASIINQGTINISDSGYAALFGKEVTNEGIIKATLGSVHVRGASEVVLNLNGNSLVDLHVNKGVLDALVENKGAIYADGGEVYLTTNAVNELLRGVVNNTGIVEANSMDDITGEIILFAHGGTANVSGSLEAKDGFVETSGQVLHVSKDSSIKAKEWLVDPTDIVIVNGGVDGIGGSSMDASVIITALSSGAVILQATNSITVNENIWWESNKKLSLNAGNSILVNASIINYHPNSGGVYFNELFTGSRVIFGSNGEVVINNPQQLQWINTALQGTYKLGDTVNAREESARRAAILDAQVSAQYNSVATRATTSIQQTIAALQNARTNIQSNPNSVDVNQLVQIAELMLQLQQRAQQNNDALNSMMSEINQAQNQAQNTLQAAQSILINNIINGSITIGGGIPILINNGGLNSPAILNR